ncbi:MAG: outer membrane protein assembly factor BamD [Bacteroidia bacterium]
MRGSLYLTLTLISLFAAGCSDYNKIYKSSNPTMKYGLAMQLYEEKDYNKALPLLEQLRDYYKNTDSMELIYYRTAYAYYGLKDYSYASMFFKDFTESFTRSPRSIECAYMALYCDVLEVSDYDLDQSQTLNIIGALQTFINYYPNSEYVAKCNEHIDDLRGRLQQKEYEWAIQYYRMEQYKAAVYACRNAIKQYPDIPQKEELEFMALKAQYLYADGSVEIKRLERLEEAKLAWDDYYYANGKTGSHYDEAFELYQRIQKEIQQLKSIL